jgi:transcriptional regulator with PAS, ATPase and Fis domain
MSRMGYTPPKAAKNGGNAPSGYRFTADGSRLEAIPGGPADTGGDYQLSREAVSNAAWDFIMTGTKPQFARSHEGDKQRIAIQNEVANIAKQAGVSPQELATQKGKYKALQTSLANITKQSDMLDKQTETFHRNADLMLEKSKAVSRYDSAVLNKYLLNFNLQWKGDPATAAYIAAARTAINEYAKVASGATGASGSTDTARREAQEAISAAQNPQQLAAVIQTLKQDAENQRNATHDQLIGISARMTQFGKQPGPAVNNDPLGILGK